MAFGDLGLGAVVIGLLGLVVWMFRRPGSGDGDSSSFWSSDLSSDGSSGGDSGGGGDGGGGGGD